MAYILGFFAADGYITVNRRNGQYWCIQIKDGELLNEIKKTIKSTHTISLRKSKENANDLFRIQIGSIEMCDDLRRLGFNENKTKNMSIPKVPNKYFIDFVRGYFDGDGNVWVGLVKKGKNTRSWVIQTAFTSCSYNFLEKLRLRLDQIDVKKGVLRKTKKNAYRLVYSVFGSLKLYKLMYNRLYGSKLYLNRKKRVFEKYIKMKTIDNAVVV